MTRDELEFSISQYVDGTIDERGRAALDERLATDAEARQILAEYRRLDDALRRAIPVPQLNWDRLAARISDAVADADAVAEPATTYRLFTFRSLAIAASILIAVGIAIPLLRSTDHGMVNHPQAVVQITGPAAEAATQPAVANVSVGPNSVADQNRYQLSEGIVYQPSRVSLIVSGPESGEDTERSPFQR